MAYRTKKEKAAFRAGILAANKRKTKRVRRPRYTY